jgi:hypothetical protein
VQSNCVLFRKYFVVAVTKHCGYACDPARDVEEYDIDGVIPRALLLAIVLMDAARTLRRRGWPRGTKCWIDYFIRLFLHQHGPDEI